MSPTRSVLVLLTLLVLASGVWGVWRVLRIEPLAPESTTVTSDAESASTSVDEHASDLSEPEDELAEPEGPDPDESRVAEALEEDDVGPAAKTAAGPSSIVHGVLIDEDTREPLPHYLLKLQDEAGARLDVTTDDKGRFVTTAKLAHGSIQVRPIDHPKRRAKAAPITREFPPPEGRELEITTRSGPTFRLAIVPDTVPAGSLEARLRVSGKDVRSSQDYDPVREGTPPWVRLPPVTGESLEARGIDVRDRDGLWSGRAEVNRVAGVAHEVVRVVLEPRARFSGRVVDDRSRPIANANVSMKFVAGETVGQERTATTEADGAWRFDHLPAGTVSVSVRAFRYEPQTDVRIALVPGDVSDRTITLARMPPAGSIRGRVTSESGGYDSPARAMLTLVDSTDAMPPQHAQIVWNDSAGQRVGTFEFTELPAGKYRIAGKSEGNWYELAPEWKPGSLFASPPDDGVSFLILDSTARADLVLRVTDADTGESIDGARGWFQIGKKSGRARDVDSGGIAISGFPYEETLRWRIDKAGYRPVIGDAASFAIETRSDGKTQRIAEVALARGWGDLYRVADKDGKNGLAGARILLDGVEAGVTDSEGFVLARAQERPKEIRFEYRDWVVRGRIDTTPATRRKNPYYVAVAMQPPKKR